jgi:hypothetical protein
MESALAFPGLIDPQAFEIALTGVAPPADQIPEIPGVAAAPSSGSHKGLGFGRNVGFIMQG